MAAKYMGAKMLRKQMERQKAKDDAKEDKRNAKRGAMVANTGEILDRGTQKFDLTAAAMHMDGDFVKIDEKHDKNPKFTACYKMLSSRTEDFFLTSNEMLIEQPAESESEDEQ